MPRFSEIGLAYVDDNFSLDGSRRPSNVIIAGLYSLRGPPSTLRGISQSDINFRQQDHTLKGLSRLSERHRAGGVQHIVMYHSIRIMSENWLLLLNAQ